MVVTNMPINTIISIWTFTTYKCNKDCKNCNDEQTKKKGAMCIWRVRCKDLAVCTLQILLLHVGNIRRHTFNKRETIGNIIYNLYSQSQGYNYLLLFLKGFFHYSIFRCSP